MRKEEEKGQRAREFNRGIVNEKIQEVYKNRR